ncbi:concanavalin A-like lectin/glucanase domain-containing protein [Cytidiella melzeri]|nr:concanavalin A-like lectin/glucanase domain-containing protein [Cytidiella melzeri]
MFIQLVAVVGLLSASVSPVFAQGGQVCNATSLCGASAPCCSEYGFCGTGSFCLGGCNPLFSQSLDSCAPSPVCEPTTHTFPDLSRVAMNASDYDGNATAFDWVLDKGNILNTNVSGGELGLILTETNGGTRLSSTRYVHYGTITARLKTGRWAGVVTAFITMSDVKDEIDWEFPGDETLNGQSNIFWQGVVPAQTQGETHNISSDSFSNYHDYTIDWKPDTLTWSIDNNVVRTLQRSDTVDSKGISHFPNTPSRVQLSLWPAGINTSAPGTVAWAGGMINWADPDYVSAGHFYALVQSVSIKCSDPESEPADTSSYVYGKNTSLDTPSVAFSNLSTINAARGLSGLSGESIILTIVSTVIVSLFGALLA